MILSRHTSPEKFQGNEVQSEASCWDFCNRHFDDRNLTEWCRFSIRFYYFSKFHFHYLSHHRDFKWIERRPRFFLFWLCSLERKSNPDTVTFYAITCINYGNEQFRDQQRKRMHVENPFEMSNNIGHRWIETGT